nr:cupin-like domain-containing protein [Sphingomonas faeni]
MLERTAVDYVGAPTIAGRFLYREDMNGFNFDRWTAPFRAVANMLLGDLATGAGPAIYSGAASAAEHVPTFAADNPMPLLDPTATPRLWIGNAVTVSTHYDTADNIACVAAGHRRFTLFPSEQVANLYVGPLENTISGQPVSMVDRWRPTWTAFHAMLWPRRRRGRRCLRLAARSMCRRCGGITFARPDSQRSDRARRYGQCCSATFRLSSFRWPRALPQTRIIVLSRGSRAGF